MSNALALNGVSVRLGPSLIVDRFTADIGEGEWVVVIGPNGAGKTTLLRAVAGLVGHDGRIEIQGEEVTRLSRRAIAQRIAVVPQVPLMPGETTVRQYVLLGRTPFVGYFGSEGRPDHEVVDAVLERLDLMSLARRRLDSLSGGERQRAILARALAQEAPILLLDEPTASLDVGRQQQVLELVDRLRAERGLTVLSTMHDLTLAGQYGDRLLLLDRGRLAASGTAADVLTGPLIATHYGAEVHIVAEPGRDVAVVPIRRRAGPG